MDAPEHIPVMMSEVLAGLDPKRNENYVDFTLGGGGHTQAILERTRPLGKVLAFDRDSKTLERTKEKLKNNKDRVIFFHSKMSDSEDALEKYGFQSIDGVLMDLGVSSFQIDEPTRGFSFQKAGPLDMRMDPSQGPTLKEALKGMKEQELADIIYQFGEERQSRKIASRIIDALKKGALSTTEDLSLLIKNVYPFQGKKSKVHPATKTFQALRIFLNNELDELSKTLLFLKKNLKPKAKVAIITFHSLEDRIVKHEFRRWAQEEVGQVLTKKPLVPTEEEIEKNPRSRSAKLRLFEMGMI